MSIKDIVYGAAGSRTEIILGKEYSPLVDEIILGQVAALQMADESICFALFEEKQSKKRYNCFGFQRKNESDLRFTAYAHYKVWEEEEINLFDRFRELTYLTEAGFEELKKEKEVNLESLSQFSFDFSPLGLPKSYLKALLHGFFYQEEKAMTKLTLKKSVSEDILTFQKEVLGILETLFLYLPNAMKQNTGFVSHLTKQDLKLEKGIKIVVYDKAFVDSADSIDLDKEEIEIEEKKIIQNSELGVTKKETKAFVDWLVETTQEERTLFFKEMTKAFPDDFKKVKCGSCKYIFLWNLLENVIPSLPSARQLIHLYYQVRRQIQEKIIDIQEEFLKQKIEAILDTQGIPFQMASKEWAYAEIENQLLKYQDIASIFENSKQFLEQILNPLGFSFTITDKTIDSMIQNRIVKLLDQVSDLEKIEALFPILEEKEICFQKAQEKYMDFMIKEKIKPCKTIKQFEKLFEEQKTTFPSFLFKPMVDQYAKLIQKAYQALTKEQTDSISEEQLSYTVLFSSKFFSFCMQQIQQSGKKANQDVMISTLGKTKLWLIKALKIFISADTIQLEDIIEKKEILERLNQKVKKIHKENPALLGILNQPIEDKTAQLDRWMIQLEREEKQEKKEELPSVLNNDQKKKSKIKINPKIFALCILFLCFLTVFHSQQLSKKKKTPIEPNEINLSEQKEQIPDKFLTIQVGMRHTMAIKEDNSLWGWGNNEYGQLGNSTFEGTDVQVKILDYAKEVSVGYNFTAAIATEGSLWTWGCNKKGQLGDGTLKTRFTPRKIKSKAKFLQVSAGSSHVMAITQEGDLWGFGSNSYGQLGNNSVKNQTKPILIMKNVKMVSAGDDYTIALKKDGTLWAWGRNQNGQLGDGTIEDKHKPVLIDLEETEKIYAGYGHSGAIKKDGSLWMWGSNGKGQLGDGTIKNRYSPVCIPLKEVKQISLGYWYTTAVQENGDLWEWGESPRSSAANENEIEKHFYKPKKILKENADFVSANDGYFAVIKKDKTAFAKEDSLFITENDTHYLVENNTQKKEIENFYLPFLREKNKWREADFIDYRDQMYSLSEKETVNYEKEGLISGIAFDLDKDKEQEFITISFVPSQMTTALELKIYELEEKEWKEQDSVLLSEYCFNGFSYEDGCIFIKEQEETNSIVLEYMLKQEEESIIYKIFTYEKGKLKEQEKEIEELELKREKVSENFNNKKVTLDSTCILLSRFFAYPNEKKGVTAQIYDATKFFQKLIWLKTIM